MKNSNHRRRAVLQTAVSMTILLTALFSGGAVAQTPTTTATPTRTPTFTPLPEGPLVVTKVDDGDHNLYCYNLPVAGDWSYWDSAARNPSPLARDFWMIPSGNGMVAVTKVNSDGQGEEELAVLKADGGVDQNIYLYTIPMEGDWTAWDCETRNASPLARDLWVIPSGNGAISIADNGSLIACMKKEDGDCNLYVYNSPLPGDWTYWDCAARNPSPLARDLWIVPEGNDAVAACGLDITGDGIGDSLVVVDNDMGTYSIYLWNTPEAGDWTYWDALARNPSPRARDLWVIPEGNAVASVAGVHVEGDGEARDALAVIQDLRGDHNLYLWNAPRAGDWSEEDAAARNPSPLARDFWMVTEGNTTLKAMPRGRIDPDLFVCVYRHDRVYPGTTLLTDPHIAERPRVLEVNMLGEIVWQYLVPGEWAQYTQPGFDAERLPNGNILLVLPRKGIIEIDRTGSGAWSHFDEKVSHDADRLPNGNTIYVFGANDQIGDAQVKEVNPAGELVWAWYARDHFNKAPYTSIYSEGWTHCNAVSRMQNGNTLISLRNFAFVIEVSPQGTVVDTIGEDVLHSPHDPEMLSNGNVLVVSQWPPTPNHAVEVHPESNGIVWSFGGDRWTVCDQHESWVLARDANRLPNGNTLITGTTEVIEVTPEGEIVWQLGMEAEGWEGRGSESLGFYKGHRIPTYFK